MMEWKAMERHLVSSHTKEELWRWSISYEKLIAAIENGTKSIKSSVCEGKVSYKAVNANLKCSE